MSTLYKIRVEKLIDETTVKLNVKVVHPDSMIIHETPGFVLMVLHDQAEGKDPLKRAVDFNSLLDESWMHEYARGFVQEVKCTELIYDVPDKAADDYDHPYWDNTKIWLEGILQIKVTHPAWIQHLKEGASWDSAAFDVAGYYEECDPILEDDSEKEDGPLDTNIQKSDGFMPVPCMVYMEPESEDSVTAKFPKIIWHPRFSIRSYCVASPISGVEINKSSAAELIGLPVIAEGNDGERKMGFITTMDEECIMIHQITSSSKSGARLNYDEISSIGAAAFKSDFKRHGSPLKYTDFMSFLSAFAKIEKVEGNEAEILVYQFNPDEDIEFLSESNVLNLITEHLNDWGFEDRKEKIAMTLHKYMQENDIDSESDAYQETAKGFIESFFVEELENEEVPDLDTLQKSQVIEYLNHTSIWPGVRIKIKTTDSAWLEHLYEGQAYPYEPDYPEEAADWDLPPLVWDEDWKILPEEDDDEDDSANSEDSGTRRLFNLKREAVKENKETAEMPSDDPRRILRAFGCLEDVKHERALDQFMDKCKEGNLEAVKAFVSLGVDVNFREDSSKEMPLTRATEGNHPEIIEFLIKSGAQINARDDGGDTALMTAINWNHPEAAEKLLEMGADPDIPDNYQNIPLVQNLETAIEDKDEGKKKKVETRKKITDILLEGGADPNAEAVSRDSMLHFALSKGKKNLLLKCLSYKGNPNLSDKSGSTLLMIAAAEENQKMVSLLLENGADSSLKNKWGCIAYDAALEKGNTELCEILKISNDSSENSAELLRAASCGDMEQIKSLLANGANIDSRNWEGKTPLMFAAESNNADAALFLIENGCDMNALCSDNKNALYYAEESDLAMKFLQEGIHPNMPDENGKLYCPNLSNALDDNDNQQYLKALIDAGAELNDLSHLNSTLVWGDFKEKNRMNSLKLLADAKADLEAPSSIDGDTLLIAYCDNEHVQIVKALIEFGADINGVNATRETPLHKACGMSVDEDNSAVMVKALLDAGADYTRLSWVYNSPWDEAKDDMNDQEASVENFEAVFEKTLSQAKKNCSQNETDEPDGKTFKALRELSNMETFLYWVREKKYNIVEGLLKAGFNPNPSETGTLPLNIAVNEKDIKMLEILLEGGADPNLQEGYGSFALDKAAQCDDEESGMQMTKMLLNYSAKLNLKDEYLGTALITAVSQGYLELAKLLVRNGALLEPNPTGRSALFYAARKGFFEIAEWLLDQGVNINIVNDDRETALMAAVEAKKTEMALALIAAGADVNVQTVKKETALLSAVKAGNRELITALRIAGADPNAEDEDGNSSVYHAGLRSDLKDLFPEAVQKQASSGYDTTDRSIPELIRTICEQNREAFAKILSEETVGQKNYRGDTPLMMAAAYGSRHMIEALLNAGADLNEKNDLGDTAWTYAMNENNTELTGLLKEKGHQISMDALNQYAGQGMRRDELAKAIKSGNLAKAEEIIRKKEVGINFLSASVSPLSLAISKKDQDMVNLLLRLGADRSLKRKDGRTIAEMAEEKGINIV
ncbi:MAG: ankyrin repeat domain-containing protein [Spirochaetia bacterium]|nr:ankyrin repeat domain-containing protein [Spirochaetia bacterium]